MIELEDKVLEAITGYTARMAPEDIAPEALLEVRRRFFDSIGVALGSLTVGTTRSLLERFRELGAPPLGESPHSTLWGLGYTLNPLDAVFANGFLVRYLDFNDTYLSMEPLHPSDVIPAIISVAEAYGAPMKRAMAAIAMAYDIGMSLCDVASPRRHGWDHVNFIGLAVASSVAWLLGLSPEQTANSISIFATSSLATRQSRVGALSSWKGAAAASSSRNAAFSALLASFGFTGPSSPLEGEMGFVKQVLGGEFDVEGFRALLEGSRGSRILESYIKPYPVEYHIQTAVDAALRLRRRIGNVDGIESIRVTTFSAANDIVVNGKWKPTNKETADHSMPYLIAYALARGEPWLEAYAEENYADPTIRRLMKAQTYEIADEFNSIYPSFIPAQIEIHMKDGIIERERVDLASGHPRNPLSNEQLELKFRRLAGGLPVDVGSISNMLLRSADAPEMGELLREIDISGMRRSGR